MQKKTQRGFWTLKREISLVNFHQKYASKGNVYSKIANRFNGKVSVNAVYKKLGRMGLVNAPWVRSEKKNSK